MLEALGTELKASRRAQNASLEAVAGEAGISAPYLLKLERGEVNSPSPRILARVARALHLPYLRLMELAGYLDEEDLAAARTRVPQPHPLAGQALSEGEWQRVAAFIRKLVADRP